MKLNLWLLYLRSKLRRKDPELVKAAKEETTRAQDLAKQLIERERELLTAKGLGNSYKLKEMRFVELIFLWGVFHELVQEYPKLPTNKLDRIILHLMMFLINDQGLSLEKAREISKGIDEIYNKADDQFDEISDLGKKSFHDKQSGRLVTVVKALLDLPSELEWSDAPGAYEAHLMRRSNNVYFPASRRKVTEDELLEARQKDKDDCKIIKQQFVQLLNDTKALSGTIDLEEFNKLRERMDDLILFARGVGGPASETASEVDQLRDALILGLREQHSDNEIVLEVIETADTFHNDVVGKFNIPVLAQMLRKESPILKEETIPTMLSESPEIISIMMNIMPEGQRPDIQVGALTLMQEALDEGYIDPQFEEKMAALNGEIKFTI